MAQRNLLKQFLIPVLFVFVSGCSSAPVKVDPRFDPSAGLGSNEGVASGTYMHPVAISKSLSFPSDHRAELVFQGNEPGNTIRIQTASDGKFAFKAPLGKYRLTQILTRPRDEIFEGPKDGFEFEIQAGKPAVVGSLYSSCDEWNDNPTIQKRFQEFISSRSYQSMKRYDSKNFSCLVFLADH